MALPPYIERDPTEADKKKYQTIFARERGAVAAPVAGMHFTPELVDKIEAKGVDMLPITLHIGWGTFRKVEVEDLTKHRMDSENFTISEETSAKVNRALKNPNAKVIGCGSTAVRTLDTSGIVSDLSTSATGSNDKS